MADSVLTVRHISKSFGSVRALKDVGLDVRAGEVHALMGENGAKQIDPDEHIGRRVAA